MLFSLSILDLIGYMLVGTALARKCGVSGAHWWTVRNGWSHYTGVLFRRWNFECLSLNYLFELLPNMSCGIYWGCFMMVVIFHYYKPHHFNLKLSSPLRKHFFAVIYLFSFFSETRKHNLWWCIFTPFFIGNRTYIFQVPPLVTDEVKNSCRRRSKLANNSSPNAIDLFFLHTLLGCCCDVQD